MTTNEAREQVRREELLERARRERQAEIAKRDAMHRAHDERSTARAIERERKRSEAWAAINERNTRGRAPHEVTR